MRVAPSTFVEKVGDVFRSPRDKDNERERERERDRSGVICSMGVRERERGRGRERRAATQQVEGDGVPGTVPAAKRGHRRTSHYDNGDRRGVSAHP